MSLCQQEIPFVRLNSRFESTKEMMKNRYKEKYQVGNFLFFECEKEKEKEKDLDCGGPRTRDVEGGSYGCC